MKVILNEDVKYLGEEGDIKDVANGYARNYLFPRSLAVPCNPMTLAYFETRKAEIEAKKEAKRADAAGLKERLEATVINISMPAGANGKLYGAVTAQTVTEALHALGFDIERKRIELPVLAIKSVGKYSAVIRLYESASATVQIAVSAQGAEAKSAESKGEAAREKPSSEEKPAESKTPEPETPSEGFGDAGADSAESAAESAQESV